MKYRKLGKTGIEVSEISYGAWTIGGSHYGKTDDKESISAIHAALGSGVNFIDTANTYGNGHSETLIAKALKGMKEKPFIATKAGNDYHNSPTLVPNYDAKYLEFCVNESLKRLEVEAIDLFQLHGPPLDVLEKGEVYETLDKLKKEGKIRFSGISVRSYHEFDEGELAANQDKVDVFQIRYNSIEQFPNQKLLPQCGEKNIGTIIRTPLLFGLLAGRFSKDSQFGEGDHRKHTLSPDLLEVYIDQFNSLDFLLDGSLGTPAQVAIRFVLSHPAVSTTIPGGRNPKQVEMNNAASEMGSLPEDILQKVYEIGKDFEEIGATKFR